MATTGLGQATPALDAASWHTPLLTNIAIVDAAITGSFDITATTGTVNIPSVDETNDAGKAMRLFTSGVLVGNLQVNLPARPKLWVLQNANTGAFATTFVLGPSAIVVAQGQSVIVFSTGTALVQVTQQLPLGAANGNFLRWNNGPEWNAPVMGLQIDLDVGDDLIAAGLATETVLPFNGEILGWTMVANTAGNLVVELMKAAYPAIPVIGDKITATAPPTLTAAEHNADGTLTGWNKTFLAGERLKAQVTGVPTAISRANLILNVKRV